MDSIKRLYVEKKKGCDVEATHLFEDIKESLNITGLTGLRILNRYDIEGISSKDYESAKTTETGANQPFARIVRDRFAKQ